MSDITTGVYHDLSNEDYHAIKEINGKLDRMMEILIRK